MTELKKKKIEKDLNKCLFNAIKKENSLLLYLTISKNMEIISRKIKNDIEKGDSTLNESYFKTIDEIFLLEDKLEKNGKTILHFQNELSFKVYYQLLEELLFDLFVVLFQHFPEYLNKDKIELNFDLLFKENDIENIRKRLIEQRAKKYIQGNNIKTIIEKFKTVFGIKISIPKAEMDKVFTASKIRNVLTHNNGIINDFYINELKHEKIKSNYNLGDSVFDNLKKEILLIENIIEDIGQIIVDELILKLNQLNNYSSKI